MDSGARWGHRQGRQQRDQKERERERKREVRETQRDSFGLHQGQGFKLACYESFLQIPVRGRESDISHVSHHYVLHTDVIFLLSPAQLWQVGKFLDPDDGIIQGRLQTLSHGIGQYHSDHHGQDVRDLTGQLEHNDGSGHGVSDCARKSRRPYNCVSAGNYGIYSAVGMYPIGEDGGHALADQSTERSS